MLIMAVPSEPARSQLGKISPSKETPNTRHGHSRSLIGTLGGPSKPGKKNIIYGLTIIVLGWHKSQFAKQVLT